MPAEPDHPPQPTSWQMARLIVNLVASLGSVAGHAVIPATADHYCRDLHRQIVAVAPAEQKMMREAIRPSDPAQVLCLGIEAREHIKASLEQGLRIDEPTLELVKFREQQRNSSQRLIATRASQQRRRQRRR